MSTTLTCQPDMTTVVVSFETVDGGTSGTTSVLTTGSQADEEVVALKTYLQFTFGWKPDDIVLEMYEPGKYVILFDTASLRFLRECSVVVSEGGTTTETDKETVQTELCEYIRRNHIRELDLNDIYSYYNITAICERAFYYCTSLTTIAIPDSIPAIGEATFAGCASLTTIAIPDGVTSIREYAFEGCTSLTTVDIPSSVTAIRDTAFSGCTSLI